MHIWFVAKSATTVFKEHGTQVEGLCHQIANEVVDLITIHFQTEEAANAVSTQMERRASLVEASLGRNWQTSSFTSSFSGINKSEKNFNSSCEFTLSFMEKLQRKVQSNPNRQLNVNTKELHQSLRISLTIAESDVKPKRQIFDEEVEETMRQLLNPVAGDADDLASQIIDRIPDDIMGLLNVKLTSSKGLPISKIDPLESAHAVILEVLVNFMSLELSDNEINDKFSESKPTITKENLTSPSFKKEASSPSKSSAIDPTRQGSSERSEATSDASEAASSVISAQLLFSQLTTTIAHAVIEKLNIETKGSHLISTDSESEDGPPLPFLKRPNDASDNAARDNPGATIDDTNQEHVMIVVYPSKNGK